MSATQDFAPARPCSSQPNASPRRFAARARALAVRLRACAGLGALCALLAATPLRAAGPAEIASADRAAWPRPIDSPAAFDRASRAEILAFAHELSLSEPLDDAALAQRLRLKQIDRASLDKIRARYWQRLADNYRLASRACAPREPFCAPAADADALRKLAADFDAAPAPAFAAWRADAARFHRIYLDEQLRLAALFPRTSSEIDTYSAQELDGSELPDRQFLLTFDDGPTAVGGNTDALLRMLRENRLNATFFVLGQQLQPRMKSEAPAKTYAGMCVASHGWEHQSHSRWPQWQDSVIRSSALIRQETGALYRPLFRPPYGQRRADSGEFFREQGLRVALWTIDSQDWNAKVDAGQVQGRLLSLMLLWRHGTILFHDIHDKARVAVPWLLRQTRGAGVQWVDCRRYPSP
ncbi:polysaccharide deacetylase family protein [Lysobacter sp. K5869]|uniref:polysaccharide deacetylase family protein n=1 Tax=Lysobacter sp. K5869 TaxID=2820808 RepID=UPI001C060569|nr:polysaccharide deacetylase family protein [Lysobacter sp. K5869]QWP74677.1 polysaccharide deacetylase family protein [Lysobacter sp. K5869]